MRQKRRQTDSRSSCETINHHVTTYIAEEENRKVFLAGPLLLEGLLSLENGRSVKNSSDVLFTQMGMQYHKFLGYAIEVLMPEEKAKFTESFRHNPLFGNFTNTQRGVIENALSGEKSFFKVSLGEWLANN